MTAPLVSIVIPTFNRPQFLPRAIDSALSSAPDGDVEVIVVPNGPDASWKTVAVRYIKNDRVQWQPIEIGNSNAARNHGKRLARGEYLRFLDDDDALMPSNAVNQTIALVSKKAEICSGTIDVVDKNGAFLRHMPHADDLDFFAAMARPGRICLPTAHLFRRRSILEYFWDELIRVEQDTEWMLRISSHRDWHWIAFAGTVGNWTWHDKSRVSSTITGASRSRLTTELLIRSLKALQQRNALSEEKKSAIAEALWESAHRSFYLDPFRSSKTIKFARRLSPNCKPPSAFFNKRIVSRINPLIIEWSVLPKRWINHIVRILSTKGKR